MTVHSEDAAEFDELEARIRVILPEQYQDDYDDVQPVSMGSAGLRYGSDGKVAWDEIWGSFCDLAMAGGPPHRGTLLQPGRPEEIAEQANRYDEVVDEICRGIEKVTGLFARPAPVPGWVRLYCTSAVMAGWLARAIVMENVAASSKGLVLSLPVSPAYRLEKEIKNVVTAVAKAIHYWRDHVSSTKQQAIADLFAALDKTSPLIQPAVLDESYDAVGERALANKISDSLYQSTGLRASNSRYPGWLSLECPSVGIAISIMRVLVVSNVLSRREETLVFLPLNSASDPDGDRMTKRVILAYGFVTERHMA